MYSEAFRNIIQQVYKDQPIIESTADYVVVHPVSFVEVVGEDYYFEVNESLYKYSDEKLEPANWMEVSNTFRTITTLLESNICEVDNDTITVKLGESVYKISKQDEIVKEGREGKLDMDSQKLRENNRLVLMTTNPRKRNYVAGILEAIALTCENYDRIVNLDNVGVYTTKNDQFLVIENGNNLYATLLKSNHASKWTVDENALEVVTFIKNKTNVTLNECYKEQIDNVIGEFSAKDAERIQESIKSAEISNYKQRIEALTEKFKNDPVKLAVLSNLAKEISGIE